MSFDGKIQVLSSKDGENWQHHSTISWAGADLRDPKLSVNPENELILNLGIRWAVYPAGTARLYSAGFKLNPEVSLENPQITSCNQIWLGPFISEKDYGKWRWATSWQSDFAYSVGYGGGDKHGCLYRSANGFDWQEWVKPFFPDQKIYTNESSIYFSDETAYCLVRRDGKGGKPALLGTSFPPYKHWQWQTLPTQLGGPKLIQLSNGEFVAAGRYINYKRWTARTIIYKIDPAKNTMKVWRKLPSGGDCSYPGMVEKDGKLFVSYYTTTSERELLICLATIPLQTKKRSRKFR